MANDSADFSVRLHDELTGPARAMRAELKGLLGDLKKFDAGGGAGRGRRATDGIREPKMISANDRIRIQERADAAERKARERTERDEARAAKEAAREQVRLDAAERKSQERLSAAQMRANKASDRGAANDRKQVERSAKAEQVAKDRAVKAQERDSARLRNLMLRDEKARLSSVARQDRAYLAAAKNQERANVRVERERLRAAKKATAEERSRAAFLAHKKVLDGGVGAEVKGLLAGGGGGSGGVGSLVSGLGSIGPLSAGIGAVAAGVAAIGTAAAAAAVGVGILAAKLAGESVAAFRFSQSSEFAIQSLTRGTADSARAEFDDVRAMAEELGLSVKGTVNSFKELLGAQFDIGQSKDLIRMSSDMRTTGANAMQVEGAIRAISQIKSTGVLQGDELMQISNAGIAVKSIREELMKLKGVGSLEEVLKLQEAGKIDADTAIKAIMAAVAKESNSKTPGEAGKRFATSTLDGMLGVLDAGIENLFTEMGRELGPIVQPLAGLVVDAFNTIKNHEGLKVLGDAIIDRLGKARDWVVKNWPEIKATLVTGLDAAAKAGLGLIAVGDWIVANWDEIGPVLKVAGMAAGGVALSIGLIGTALAGCLAPIAAFWWGISKIVAGLEKLKELVAEISPQKMASRIFGTPIKPQKTPERIAEDKANAKASASLGGLKVGGGIAANDNEAPWYDPQRKKIKVADQGVGARTAVVPLKAETEDPMAQFATKQTVKPVSVSPALARGMQTGPAAPPKESTEAANLQLEAAKLQVEAAQAQAKAAATAGSRGGGESDLAGMLEAV
jgi:tape measure domain-containing protein